MAAVNQEQLIGSLIPDVYIKTVTLETAGTPIRETNPHIDHARETVRVQKSPSDSLLIVNLDLLLKEQLDNGIIDTWFSNQDFQKYLRFVVIQSTDPLVTKIMSASNNAIQLANINSAVEAAVFVAELMEELKELPEFASIGGRPPAYSEEDIPELLELIFENTSTKYISIKEHFLNNKSLLNQQYSSTSSTGERIYDITFRLKFEVPTKTPRHLSYFAVSSIDIDQLIEDYNLDASGAYLFELMNGKVATDTVIRNGSLVSKSFVFKDANGNIWSGPVHQAEGGWLTGTVDSEVKEPVTKHEVENNKIQDFRNFDELEKLQLDFSIVQNKLFNVNLPFKRLTNDNMDVPRTESYFSEVALARDSRGAARLAFAIDYGKMIKDHTQYGALYSKANQDELFKNVKVRNFQIKRRRMTREFTTLNRLGSPTQLRDIFDKDEPFEVISYTGESRPGEMQKSVSTKGAVKEIVIELDSEFDEVRHFTAIDKTMPLVTDGFYQYGVEIVVEDNTQKFINNKIRDLSVAKYWLDYYYNTATLPNHFDPVSNRFTEEFIEKMYSKYGWKKNQERPVRSPWIQPLITYLSVLSFFRKSSVDIKLAAALWKYLDPKSGNPRGIAMVQKLIENLMQRLASATGANLQSQRSKGIRADSDGNFVRPSSILTPGKPQVKTFTIEYFFPQLFDSNVPKGLGYDFLSPGALERESNEDGLRVITGAEYEKRTELESLKYFTSTTANINMTDGAAVYTKNDSVDNTRLTFLTPSNVSLGTQGNISLLDNAFDAQASLRIQTSIANINLARKSPFLPLLPPSPKKNTQAALQLNKDELQVKSQLTNIMANFNCTLITPVSSPYHNIRQLLEEDYDPYTDVDDILGREWAEVDVIVSGEPGEADEQETNLNPIPLFANLAAPLFLDGVGTSNIKSQHPITNQAGSREARSQAGFKFSMDFYELGSDSRSAIRTFIKSENMTALVSPTAQPPGASPNIVTPKIMTVMAGLPNQIKSLFLAKATTGVTRYDWTGARSSLLQTPAGKAAFIFNYKTLRKTEAMIGYKIDSNGHPLLKHPIWVPLTYSVFRRAGDKNLLCRTVKYENKAFGVEEAKGTRLPVYNKYFIISNPGTASGLLRRGRVLYRDRLSRRLNRILRQHRFLSSEYLSTAVISSKRIIPKRASRQRIIRNTDLTKNLKSGRIV